MTKENALTPEDSVKERAAVENQSNGEPPPLSMHGTDNIYEPTSAANENAQSPLQSRQLSHAEKPNDLSLRPTLRIASNQKSDHHPKQEQQQQQQISNDTDPTSRTTVSSSSSSSHSSHSKPPPGSVTTTTSVISPPDSFNSESISGNPNHHHAPTIAVQHPHGETNNASMLVSSQAVDATESDAAARDADGDGLTLPIAAAATPTGSASGTHQDVQAHSSTNTPEMYRMEEGRAAYEFAAAPPTGLAPGTLNDAVLGTRPSDSVQPHSSNTRDFVGMELGGSVTFQHAVDAAQSTIPPTPQDGVPFPSPNASVAGSTSSAHQGNPVECFTEAPTAHQDGDRVDSSAAAFCARSLGQEPKGDQGQLADGNNLTNVAAIQQKSTGLRVVEQGDAPCLVSTTLVSLTGSAAPTSRNSFFANARDSRNAVGTPSQDSQIPDDHGSPAWMSIDSGASHCSDENSAEQKGNEVLSLLHALVPDESSSTNKVGTPRGDPQPLEDSGPKELHVKSNSSCEKDDGKLGAMGRPLGQENGIAKATGVGVHTEVTMPVDDHNPHVGDIQNSSPLDTSASPSMSCSSILAESLFPCGTSSVALDQNSCVSDLNGSEISSKGSVIESDPDKPPTADPNDSNISFPHMNADATATVDDVVGDGTAGDDRVRRQEAVLDPSSSFASTPGDTDALAALQSQVQELRSLVLLLVRTPNSQEALGHETETAQLITAIRAQSALADSVAGDSHMTSVCLPQLSGAVTSARASDSESRSSSSSFAPSGHDNTVSSVVATGDTTESNMAVNDLPLSESSSPASGTSPESVDSNGEDPPQESDDSSSFEDLCPRDEDSNPSLSKTEYVHTSTNSGQDINEDRAADDHPDVDTSVSTEPVTPMVSSTVSGMDSVSDTVSPLADRVDSKRVNTPAKPILDNRSEEREPAIIKESNRNGPVESDEKAAGCDKSQKDDETQDSLQYSASMSPNSVPSKNCSPTPLSSLPSNAAGLTNETSRSDHATTAKSSLSLTEAGDGDFVIKDSESHKNSTSASAPPDPEILSACNENDHENQPSSHLPSGGSSTTSTSDDHESKEDASDVSWVDGDGSDEIQELGQVHDAVALDGSESDTSTGSDAIIHDTSSFTPNDTRTSEVLRRFSMVCSQHGSKSVDKCELGSDGRKFFTLAKRKKGSGGNYEVGSDLAKDVIHAFMDPKDDFMVTLLVELQEPRTRAQKRASFIKDILPILLSPAKRALGRQRLSHFDFGDIYVEYAGPVQELQLMVADESQIHCNIFLQVEQLPPVTFKNAQHIADVEKLKEVSSEWRQLPEQLLRALDRNKKCKLLVKGYGNLLAGPDAFTPTGDNGGPMALGTAHCLRGGVIYQPRLEEGSCQIFCVAGPKRKKVTDDSLYHQTSILAHLCEHLLTGNSNLDRNSKEALIKLLADSIHRTCCSVHHTFKETQGFAHRALRAKLTQLCNQVYKSEKAERELIKNIAAGP